uniref:Uncharacterized protein n=1 Tax=Steinernema glaseri TaxID=37863 RepID=A0A1I8AQR0_9BILA
MERPLNGRTKWPEFISEQNPNKGNRKLLESNRKDGSIGFGHQKHGVSFLTEGDGDKHRITATVTCTLWHLRSPPHSLGGPGVLGREADADVGLEADADERGGEEQRAQHAEEDAERRTGGQAEAQLAVQSVVHGGGLADDGHGALIYHAGNKHIPRAAKVASRDPKKHAKKDAEGVIGRAPLPRVTEGPEDTLRGAIVLQANRFREGFRLFGYRGRSAQGTTIGGGGVRAFAEDSRSPNWSRGVTMRSRLPARNPRRKTGVPYTVRPTTQLCRGGQLSIRSNIMGGLIGQRVVLAS